MSESRGAPWSLLAARRKATISSLRLATSRADHALRSCAVASSNSFNSSGLGMGRSRRRRSPSDRRMILTTVDPARGSSSSAVRTSAEMSGVFWAV